MVQDSKGSKIATLEGQKIPENIVVVNQTAIRIRFHSDWEENVPYYGSESEPMESQLTNPVFWV